MLALEEDVFLVRGGKNHAIYDLKRGKLYQIDNECLGLIEKSINEKNYQFSTKESDMLEALKKNNILKETKRKIKEIPISSLKVESKPSFAWLEITQQCNLKCVFCYEESDCHNKKHMTMEDFHKARKFLINGSSGFTALLTARILIPSFSTVSFSILLPNATYLNPATRAETY